MSPFHLRRLPPQLRRRHRGRSSVEDGQGGAGLGCCCLWAWICRFGGAVTCDGHTLGCHVVQGAKMCGASKVIGVDLNPDKEEVGRSFGVTDFVNPSQLDNRSVIEVIVEMTGGGVDYSFECIGAPSVMTDAFRCTKMGKGKTVVLGLGRDSDQVCLPSLELLFGRCVMGSLFGGIKPKTDIPILAKKCMDKELQLDALVTHELGLQEINTAFDLLLQGKCLRCIIWMDKDK
ncbi:alcohol dehydrogenase-like 5 isoform X2 [Miscanthus floridulus]|uniref:alcohol dehydrogenase-like 5 isoform X2 n=1 Tax=Miscanthus floridulus TaxID=154761 RepID=UPI00345949AA